MYRPDRVEAHLRTACCPSGMYFSCLGTNGLSIPMFSIRLFLLAVLCSIFLVFPNACNGEDPMSSPDKDQMDSLYTVGVYYYPWYSGDFHGGRYMRKELIPPQLPMLGEYDDRHPAVIAQHLKWSRQANISLWVASWWGPDSREDQTLLQRILPHDELGDMQIALFYETTGRTREFSAFNHVAPDIAHIAERYFNHPNYLRIDGRPVLFVYLTAGALTQWDAGRGGGGDARNGQRGGTRYIPRRR